MAAAFAVALVAACATGETAAGTGAGSSAPVEESVEIRYIGSVTSEGAVLDADRFPVTSTGLPMLYRVDCSQDLIGIQATESDSSVVVTMQTEPGDDSRCDAEWGTADTNEDGITIASRTMQLTLTRFHVGLEQPIGDREVELRIEHKSG